MKNNRIHVLMDFSARIQLITFNEVYHIYLYEIAMTFGMKNNWKRLVNRMPFIL